MLFRARTSPREVENRYLSVPFNVSDGVLTHTQSQAESINSALRLAPLFASVSLITDAVSTCPLRGFAYAGNNGGQLLPVQPALLTNPGEGRLGIVPWLSQALMSLLLRGNAYGVIAGMDATNTWPTKIRWLYPDWVRVDEHETLPRYFVQSHEVDPTSIIHIQGITVPGSIVGLSPLSLFRQQMDTGLRIERYKWGWYNDTAVPRGILSNKSRPLKPGEASDAKDRFKAAVNDHDVLVTGNDWGWQALMPTAADAQFLEATRATATQIAAIYHVAPEEVGGVVEQALTYKTLEANSITFAQKACKPWAVRLDNALTGMLPRTQYARFQLDKLIRVETATRMAAYAIALDNGIQTHDEVRAEEDAAPLTAAQIAAWQKYFGAGSKPAPVHIAPPNPNGNAPAVDETPPADGKAP